MANPGLFYSPRNAPFTSCRTASITGIETSVHGLDGRAVPTVATRANTDFADYTDTRANADFADSSDFLFF